MKNSGVYQLIIELKRDQRMKVGRLGRYLFPKGYYVYTGSAQSGLEARITRHTSRSSKKKLFWHIDYLLRFARIYKVIRYPGLKKEEECLLNLRVADLDYSSVIIPRFGSSDCHCRTHLYYFDCDPDTLSTMLQNN